MQAAVRYKLMWVLCPCGCLIAVRACSSSPGGAGGGLGGPGATPLSAALAEANRLWSFQALLTSWISSGVHKCVDISPQMCVLDSDCALGGALPMRHWVHLLQILSVLQW